MIFSQHTKETLVFFNTIYCYKIKLCTMVLDLQGFLWGSQRVTPSLPVKMYESL